MFCNLFSLLNYAFSIDHKGVYLHIAIVKCHCHVLQFVWQIRLHQLSFTFWVGQSPWVFTALTKPILFLCHHKGFHIVTFLDDILVMVCSKWAGKRAHAFCVLYSFALSDLCLTRVFGLCWDTIHMSVSLPPDKLADTGPHFDFLDLTNEIVSLVMPLASHHVNTGNKGKVSHDLKVIFYIILIILS